MSWLAYWLGRHRLAFGFCPACNSSPPDAGCPVCFGSYAYGVDLSPADRVRWRQRWERMR